MSFDLKRLVRLPAVVLMATAFAAGTPALAGSAYEYEFAAIEGGRLPLDAWRGKTLLVVNTASLCGFTPQYGGLQRLWERYRDRGLVVLGVPSNDFGGQEPGQAAEIKQFCEVNFGIDFPMTEKLAVTGPGAHPFYQWAAAQLGPEGVPRWNFHKILLSADGTPLKAYPSAVTPEDAALLADIDKIIGN